ncbi:MAG: N-acylglucosamine 2-epimerase [Clostridiaceae bacterium]|nr:N-acylglucosamine 2-epimerase [Clostridiaceae bacterium]
MDYRNYLINDVLKFWLSHAIDNQNGGIFTCIDEKGNIYGEDKSVWFQGRALWTFSKAYNAIDNNPQYLAAAEKIYHFLPKCTDTDNRMFFTVTKEGRQLQKRRYYFSETFAAIGCAEYYIATGQKEAWEKAEIYFDTAYTLFKNPSLSTPKLNPKNAPYKALSPVMIMLAISQVLRKVNYEKYNPVAVEMTNEILNGGYLQEDALLENVTTDGKFFDSPAGRIINPGHSLEAAWFLIAEGLFQKDESIIEKALHIIDFSMKRGLVNGGIIAFTDYCGKPPVALEWDMLLWWPQCEAIIANRLAYMVTVNEKYLQSLNALLDFAFSHFAGPENGEWYGYLHYDGTVANRLKGNIFKGPFHLPRMLMWLILSEENKALSIAAI